MADFIENRIKNKSLHLAKTTRLSEINAFTQRNEMTAWIENQLEDSFMRSAQIFMSLLVLSLPLQSNISTCQSLVFSSVPVRLGNVLP